MAPIRHRPNDPHRKVAKGGTQSAKKHRFESFNERISKLTINPASIQRPDASTGEHSDSSYSFFVDELLRWKNTNLSENFGRFVSQNESKCQTLPQVLHHHDHLFQELVNHITLSDSASLEPFLDLLVNFARDLGANFSNHINHALTMIVSVVIRSPEVEALEWGFTCLARLFRYLSRLLLPNVKQVFEIMAPLLGGESQKLYTIRFAAEAMSFLVRKAAACYKKNPTPLDTVLEAALASVPQGSEAGEAKGTAGLLQCGATSLIAKAINGSNKRLHSSGPLIYERIIEFAAVRSEDVAARAMVEHVTISMIHHTDAAGLEPIIKFMLSQIDSVNAFTDTNVIAFTGRLLYILTTVRKGSRIRDWQGIFDGSMTLLKASERLKPDQRFNIHKMIAVVVQSAPTEIVAQGHRDAMDVIAGRSNEKLFLPFCQLFNDMGRQRFEEYVLPYFKQFLTKSWHDNRLELLTAARHFVVADSGTKILMPSDWQEMAVKRFSILQECRDSLEEFSLFLDGLEVFELTYNNRSTLLQALNDHIRATVNDPSSTPLRSLMMGHGLQTYARSSPLLEGFFEDLWPSLCLQASQYGSFAPYLEAVLALIQHKGFSSTSPQPILTAKLIENLRSASHQHRLLSLRILRGLHFHEDLVYGLLDTALTIETSPLNLQTSRFISMQTRNLVTKYDLGQLDEIIRDALPSFCFGMLTYKLSQSCEDAIAALQTISKREVGFRIVSDVVFLWVNLGSCEKGPEQPETAESTGFSSPLMAEFECSNLRRLESCAEECHTISIPFRDNSQNSLSQNDDSGALQVSGARTLALRVLSSIPDIAERRSRYLVPFLLSWAGQEGAFGENGACETSDTLNGTGPPHQWSLKDRKALLDVFGHFTNPRALYKSKEVLEALTALLCNGDVQIQRASLKAIFAWKMEELQPFEDRLLNLLDDSRFKDEIPRLVEVVEQHSHEDIVRNALFKQIFLRILYGRTIARTGGSASKSIQASKRKTVMNLILRLTDDYIQEFVAIALGSLWGLALFENSILNEAKVAREYVTLRKQLGSLNMMKNMFESFGHRLHAYSVPLIEAVLYCLLRAKRRSPPQGGDEIGAVDHQNESSLLKATRGLGMQCLNLVAQKFPPHQLTNYLSTIYSAILAPSMERLSVETAQAVSGTLRLFATWASSPESVHFITNYDARTLRCITSCIVESSCKDEVILFVLDEILFKMVESLSMSLPDHETSACVEHHDRCRRIIQDNIDFLYDSLASLFKGRTSKDITASSIKLICALAHLTNDTRQARALLEVSRVLLEETSQKIGHKSKAELVQIVERFLPKAWESMPDVQTRRLFNTISGMFGFFRDQKSREIVVRVMHVFASRDQDLEAVAALCEDLNAVAEHKLDEPNFERRLAVFNTINETTFSSMSAKQWRPLFFNMLFFIRDEDELAVRSNASYALRRFVEAGSTDENLRDSEFLDLTKRVLLPALRKGGSAPSELVRVEYLKILADLVRSRPSWQEINDLRPLLMDDDDEASFFSNILHIQQHRRLRAIRRLATEARKGNLQSANVAHFLLPLLELFVFDTEGHEATHNLRAEAVLAIGDIVLSLDWPQFRSLFRRYSKLLGPESEFEKSVIKLLSLAVDSLDKASHDIEMSYAHGAGSTEELAEGANLTVHSRSRLAKSMPKGTTISTEISNSLLPALVNYLHHKEEATVSRRVLVAIPTVKLLRMLSDDQFRERLPPILTDLCNILRSRAQESRDLTRNTLGEIAILIGPTYFEFILKELRSALTRGYQLHVLSFTVHSILVTTASIYPRGSLDYCLPQIVDIVIDDIFGTTGQEKDAEEYVSKMREVKSSKSFDSMELLAQKATVTELKHLVNPVSSLLEQGFDTRRLRKIDEVLRRIAAGLTRNEASNERRMLVFCHETIRGLYRTAANSTPNLPAETTIRGKVLLSRDSAKNPGGLSNKSLSKDKLLCFSLDVTRMVLKKHDDLQTPSNLHGFMPIIGDCIVGMNEEVQTSALRLLHTIIRVPLRSIDEKAMFFVAECVKILRSATDTDTQVTQSALKLVAAILRERPNVQIRDNDLAYLLKRILPDLDEPEKQNVAFGVFKSVMGRKLMLPEVYQAMDRVAVIMVTNQNKNARNLARGAYFQFIMDYPQTKDRFSKQVAFLIGNLEFPHHEGRQSVMEVIHLLLTKSRNDQAQKSFDRFFVPLVMVVVNDESSQCREMAATLLKSLFELSDAEQKQAMIDIMRAWLKQVNEPLIRRAAFQAYALYMETNATDAAAKRESSFLISQLAHTLQTGAQNPADADWELLYVALQNMEKLCESSPDSTFDSSLGDLWANVIHMLRFPHSWVKFSAARLLGRYLADFFRSSGPDEPMRLPIEGSGGLTLSHETVIDISRASLRAFSVAGIGEDLANQCVRNLARLTKLMASTGMRWPLREHSANTTAKDDNDVQDESEDEGAQFEATDNSALSHVVYEACRILRRPPITTRAESLVPLKSMLQLLAVVIHQTPVHVFLPLISTILLPLQNLTDPNVSTPFSTDPAFREGFQSMVSNAKELMSDTQEKVGTMEYVSAVHKINQKVKTRREERRTKRVIERVADPEMAGRKKQKKLARKIESRKARGADEKARRQYM